MIPDILQNGDKFFFPAFTSAEEMGEYGSAFSKVAHHFLDVIKLAAGNEKKRLRHCHKRFFGAVCFGQRSV